MLRKMNEIGNHQDKGEYMNISQRRALLSLTFCSPNQTFDIKARIFLLVDLREFFFRFMVVRTKKNK